jgi:hypothetical protein
MTRCRSTRARLDTTACFFTLLMVLADKLTMVQHTAAPGLQRTNGQLEQAEFGGETTKSAVLE